MTEDKVLVSHALDLKMQCENDSVVHCTAFLDQRQKALLLPLERRCGEYVKTFYYGGFDDSERQLAVFVPKFYEQDSAEEFFLAYPEYDPIALLRLEKDRFSKLSHRDYLGSLMASGIKRETLGDIVLDDDGAYLFCLDSVSGFIVENIKSAGRASITVSRLEKSSFVQNEEHTKELFLSVASLRLDAVCGAAFSLSRGKASQLIASGAVFLNGVQQTEPDRKVSPNDKLVLRGKGKAVLSRINGESKKGRIHITVKRYL